MINLYWKEFNIDVSRVRAHLKTLLSSNFDGIVCDSSGLTIMFLDNSSSYVEPDTTAVLDYWDNLQASDLAPTINEIIASLLDSAVVFGEKMIKEATVGNMLLGITQAGKTAAVSDCLSKMQTYLKNGSLYAAIDEINHLLEDLDADLAPFITEARLIEYKQKIQTFLGM